MREKIGIPAIQGRSRLLKIFDMIDDSQLVPLYTGKDRIHGSSFPITQVEPRGQFMLVFWIWQVISCMSICLLLSPISAHLFSAITFFCDLLLSFFPDAYTLVALLITVVPTPNTSMATARTVTTTKVPALLFVLTNDLIIVIIYLECFTFNGEKN